MVLSLSLSLFLLPWADGVGGNAAPQALATTRKPCVNCSSVSLTLPQGSLIDRFQIKEELAAGQRILAFTISLVAGGSEGGSDAASVTELYNGSAVGSAHIALLDHKVSIVVDSTGSITSCSFER